MTNKANKNCCQECNTSPNCCGCWLFNGIRGLPLTLSLESRQTWTAISASSFCPSSSPYGNNPTGTDPTRILTSVDLPMTYQRPIPSSFLTNLTNQGYQTTRPIPTINMFGACVLPNEYLSNPNFYDPADGWHVSSEVKLYEVPGDDVWTGSLYNVTGRYFVARQYKWVTQPGPCTSENLVQQFAACVTGFVFSSDLSTWPEGSNVFGQKDVVFYRIRNGNFVSGQKTEELLPASYPVSPRSHWTRILKTDGKIRGVNFAGLNLLNSSQCCPFVSQQSGPSLSENGCRIRLTSGGVNANTIGIYASPFRGLSQTVGLGGRGDLPNVDDTPPADIVALASSCIVSECLYLHFTLSK